MTVLQELAAGSGTTAWAIASLVFFLIAWLAIAARVARARRGDMEARARLALEGDGPDRRDALPGAPPER